MWIVNERAAQLEFGAHEHVDRRPVPAGRTRTLNWKVTAVRAGTYSVRYRVAAGVDGKAVAESFDGSGPAKGSFVARVSRAPHPLEQQ